MNHSQTVVLISYPNAGKTTLFNALTGKQSKTVNYPGSTVDFEISSLEHHESIKVVDVPGITSLKAKSDDEKIAIQSLTQIYNLVSSTNAYPNLILSLVDITQATRHLVLTKQLIEQGYNVITVVTMTDLTHSKYDFVTLSRFLSTPVIVVDAKRKYNLNQLRELILSRINFSNPPKSNEKLPETNQLYEWAENALNTVLIKKELTENSFDLDRIFLHPIFGGIIFFTIMALFFYSIFSLASPFVEMIEWVMTVIMSTSKAYLPDHFLAQLFIEGILGGMAAIFVFVPQIAILFLGIGVMESSGYLARAAVLVDRPLSFIGLSGRSFVPMLSGFACAIPAVLSTRTITNQKERFICICLIPLLQCSARLPVFGLLISMLFFKNFLLASLVMTIIYIGSILITGLASFILSTVIYKTKNSHTFFMELPSYRVPIWKNIFRQVYQQTRSFVKGAGYIILILSIILWLLSEFPSPDHSFMMAIGHFIEPVFKPMGLDWRVGVAILMSFAAREVFVSILFILFGVSTETESISTLLKEATFLNSNELIFTGPTIVGLIIFFMIAMQCASTLAVIKNELKSWKIPLFQLVVFITVAYAGAVFVVSIF